MKARTDVNILLAMSVFLLTIAPMSLAKIITVDDDGPVDFDNIQAAINAAVNGDTILVADGTYTGPGNRDIDFFGKAITVKSGNGPENCIIDCQGTETEPHRGFNFSYNQDANAVIDGFTITNACAEGGAGIDCRNNQNSTLTISNCSIRSNSTFGRGANGGGISVMDGIYYIYNCTISGNSAHRGGGIHTRDNNSDISNCVISGNSAYDGGGIYFYNSNTNLKSCTINNNSSSRGGGLLCNRSSPYISNCVISGNLSDYDSDGMYNYLSDPILTNCILWDDSPSQIHNNESTPVISYCCIKDWSGGGTGNFADDPLLAPDGYHLLPTSPCINAGDPSDDYTGQTDIDGQPRVMAGRVDIGADEIALTFVAIEISGPSQVNANSQIQYNATAHSDGGDTYDATTYVLWWVEPQTFAGIDQNGVLTTGQIDSPQDITVYAQYTDNEITLKAELTVQLLPPRTLHVPAEYDTIQAAIDAAEDNEIVLVNDGIYTGDGNRDLDLRNKSITVKAQNGPENCTIDCNGTRTELHRGFNFSNNHKVNSTIDGFTIINGFAEDGGGIDCRQNQNSTLTISNCSIRNNTSFGRGGEGGGISIISGIYFINNCTISDNLAYEDGGGIYCYRSNLTISNCTISNNSSYMGSGGISYLESNSTISNCTITGNSTRYHGGGIACHSSYPDIKNCTFRGNTAQGSGGAIYSYSSSPTMINCTFSNNSADYNGGGMKNDDDSNPMLTNCIFTGNLAQWGGGMQNSESSPTLINCTFSSNSARYHGGGMGNFWVSSPTLTNCVLWGNTARYGSQIYNDVDSTVTVSYSDVQYGWPGEGNINSYPLFVDSANGDYHLQLTSLCIDAGDNKALPPDTTDLDGDGNTAEPIPWDLDGRARVLFDRIDMGAYEFNHIPIADAGPNTIAYAEPNGIAKVILDGTGSYDDDGQPLTYFWFWSIDGNDYDANGPTPTIQLPIGEHTIELIVNDGGEDSESDEVVITIVPAVECQLSILPPVMVRSGPLREIMAALRLPEDIAEKQIDSEEPIMLFPAEIPATSQYVFQWPPWRPEYTVVLGFFDKAEMMDAISDNGRVQLEVGGKLNTGQNFGGQDSIWIIGRDFRCLAGFALHWLDLDCTGPDWCDGFDLDHNGVVNFVDYALTDGCSIEAETE